MVWPSDFSSVNKGRRKLYRYQAVLLTIMTLVVTFSEGIAGYYTMACDKVNPAGTSVAGLWYLIEKSETASLTRLELY